MKIPALTVLLLGSAAVLSCTTAGAALAEDGDDHHGGDRYDLRPPGDYRSEGPRADPVPVPGSTDEFDFDDHDLDDPYFGPPRSMSEPQLETARVIVDQLYPDVGDRLTQLRNEDPERYRRTLEHRFPRLRYLVELSERDPEMFELRMGDLQLGRISLDLAERVRGARTADDRDAEHRLRSELEHTVARHFDVRQAIREREIENLKQRLEAMEDRWEDRDDDRDELIEQRLYDLAGPDW